MSQTAPSRRLVEAFHLITLAFTLLYMGISWMIGFQPGIVIQGVCASLLVGGYLWFRHTGNSTIPVNLYLANCLLVSIAGCSWYSGGIHSPVFPWLAMIPVAGVLLLGFGANAGFWGAISATIALGYGALGLTGFEFPLEYNQGWADFFSTLCTSGLVMILFVLALVFEASRRSAYRDVLTRNQELSEAREAADQATRAKGEFLANMSHEIRTPLNAIMGFAGLCEKTELNPKQADYLGKIEASAVALLAVINDILDYSKIEAGKVELEAVPFTLETTLSTLVDMVAVRAGEKGLELVSSVAPGIPAVLIGDPLHLGQVLVNLLGNAVKFTEKGHVHLRIDLVESTPDHCVLRFQVSDTGVGITEEQQARIFDSFDQGDNSVTRRYGGTGLGLAISSRLVGLLGGRLTVKSAPGQGATFAFEARFALEALSLPVPTAPAGLQGLRVLVVDDNDLACQVLMELLASFRFSAEAASSGPQALKVLAAASNHDPFDLVLVDWQMPGMDGLETVRRIRADREVGQVPVTIMVTAFGREEVLHHADKAGVNALLIKPVNASLLFDTIMNCFGVASPETRSRSLVPVARERLPQQYAGSRVLLVEDNALNQQVACELLSAAGIHAQVAANGQEALDAVTASTFDLVFMDIQMPVMGGFEATRRIRALPGVAVPIVAMTAHAMAGVREDCLAAGMNDYLSKPLDPDTLAAVLARWLQPRSNATLAPEAAIPDRGMPPPDLVGFDLASGLARLNGNWPAYRRLIVEFARTHAGDGAIARTFLAQGNLVEVQRLGHNLKGLAGNLSALRVAQEAAALEEGRGDPDALEAALREVVATAAALEPLPVATSGAMATLRERLAELESRIRRDDPTAAELLEDLDDATVAPLRSALEIYDFGAALKALSRLQEEGEP